MCRPLAELKDLLGWTHARPLSQRSDLHCWVVLDIDIGDPPSGASTSKIHTHERANSYLLGAAVGLPRHGDLVGERLSDRRDVWLDANQAPLRARKCG